MAKFDSLIKFQARDGKTYFAKLDGQAKVAAAGTTVTAYKTFEDLENNRVPEQAVIEKVSICLVALGNNYD